MAVLEYIKLTSPSGVGHKARWIGDSIEITKNVAVFDYPGVDGVSVQDLGTGATKYPLSISFDGASHRSDAKRFEESLLERGTWDIRHPVDGLLTLQPLTAKVHVQPVKSGFVTRVDTQWIRPVPKYDGVSFEATEALIKSLGDETVEAVSDVPIEDTPENRTFTISFLQDVLQKFNEFLNKYYFAARKFITDKLAAVERLIDTVGVALETMISAVVQLILLPARIVAKVKEKIAFFKDLFDSIGEALDIYTEDGTMNSAIASAQTAVMTSVLVGATESTTTGTVLSRDEAVEVSQSVLTMYQDFISRMDALQALLVARLSRYSYLGNLTTYDMFRNLVGRTVGYVLDENYSQKVKKVLITDRLYATDIFASSQYRDRSIGDAYEYFIDTNELVGDSVITLPMGLEVVLYV